MKVGILRFLLIGLIVPLAAGAADVPRLTGAGCESFGFDFYRKLSATQPPYCLDVDTNIAISPLSLASVLQAFRIGASGKAEEELNRVLQAPKGAGQPADVVQPGDLKSKAIQFSIGNSLWVDKRFELKPGFVKLAKQQLDAGVFPADFSQPEKESAKINTWLCKHTAWHITDLVTPDALKNASLVVANAVYFKADWNKPFDAAMTKEEPFHLVLGKTVQASMMNTVMECRYAMKDGVQVLELPYAGSEVSMLIVLPKQGAENLTALENRLTEDWFRGTVGNMEKRSVNIKLPRWKITCQPSDCIAVLQSMGVKKMFTPSNDFTGISDKDPLFVSAFMHRTWMEVNEKGTESAAATVAAMPSCAAPSPTKPVTFIADHPFLFVIRHNATGTPLFVGRVANPLQ